MSDSKQEQCARCGSCTVVCPVYGVTGRESLTARGKLHLLGTELAGVQSANYQDLFSQCLLCGACENICPRHLKIREQVVDARSGFPLLYGKHGIEKTVARMTLARPGLLAGLVKAGIGLQKLRILPADSGLRLKLGLLESSGEAGNALPLIGEKGPGSGREDVMYFAGCLARYVQPSIARATGELYRKASGKSLAVPGSQRCCGLAAWSSGRKEEARSLARKNISAFEGSTGPIVTSCASCSSFLRDYPDLFEGDRQWQDKAAEFGGRVQEFASFFLEELTACQLPGPHGPLRLYYHEPCHLRYDRENNDAPRRLIDSLDNITRVDKAEKGGCCGQGGLFHIGCPGLSEAIFSRVYDGVCEVGAEVVVTTCSGCLMQWQIGLTGRQSEVSAVHLADFLNRCLDIDT